MKVGLPDLKKQIMRDIIQNTSQLFLNAILGGGELKLIQVSASELMVVYNGTEFTFEEKAYSFKDLDFFLQITDEYENNKETSTAINFVA